MEKERGGRGENKSSSKILILMNEVIGTVATLGQLAQKEEPHCHSLLKTVTEVGLSQTNICPVSVPPLPTVKVQYLAHQRDSGYDQLLQLIQEERETSTKCGTLFLSLLFPTAAMMMQ